MSAAKSVGDYVLVEKIGRGSFAAVWRGYHKTTKEVVAVKVVNLQRLSKRHVNSLESEVRITQSLEHENVVRLHTLMKTEHRLYLVLEYCAGGDLAAYLKKKKAPLPERDARTILRQLAAGLRYCREKNVFHRDLKPHNLLLVKEGSLDLRIADFGFARTMEQGSLADTLCGSPLYMAPEVLESKSYDARADLWSVGAILFELVFGRTPYGGANYIELTKNIQRSAVALPGEVVLSDDCRSLILGLLQRDPEERISYDEFFAHPFVQPEDGAQSVDAEGQGAPVAANGGAAQGEEPSEQAPPVQEQEGAKLRNWAVSRPEAISTRTPIVSPFKTPHRRTQSSSSSSDEPMAASKLVTHARRLNQRALAVAHLAASQANAPLAVALYLVALEVLEKAIAYAKGQAERRGFADDEQVKLSIGVLEATFLDCLRKAEALGGDGEDVKVAQAHIYRQAIELGRQGLLDEAEGSREESMRQYHLAVLLLEVLAAQEVESEQDRVVLSGFIRNFSSRVAQLSSSCS